MGESQRTEIFSRTARGTQVEMERISSCRATAPRTGCTAGGEELRNAQHRCPRQMTGRHRQAAMRHRSTARLLVSKGLMAATLPAVPEPGTASTTIRERV